MYSKRFINILTILFSFIIFLIANFFINIQLENNFEKPIRSNVEIAKKDIQEIGIENNKVEQVIEKLEWKIIIPKISLEAPIEEGIEAEILNKYVGHFSQTQKLNGNVGLAAHNRGYPVNYFAKLKNLKEGDEIIYILGENKKTYKVIKNIQISDIDWSYLENTEENKITLITCIENKPEYRRCVQAIEK